MIYDILGKSRSLGITCKGKGHPITGYEEQVGAEIEVYSFFNLGATWRWVVNSTPRPL
jgi:hypothetical protein